MRHRLTALALALTLVLGALAPGTAGAQGFACPGFTRSPVAFAQEQITVGAAAVGFTPATMISGVRSAEAARVYVETAQIRVRDDGGNPTTTNGDVQEIGSTFWVCGTSLGSFKAIRTGGVSAVLTVTYYSRQ